MTAAMLLGGAMNNNPYDAPAGSAYRGDFVGRVLQVALVVSYCFLGLSGATFMGLTFGAAFLTTFTVKNGLEERIWVTPVGTVGRQGSRQPLPTALPPAFFPISIPSVKRGGFELEPNEAVSITYDMDDINFSEIVIENSDRVLGQLIVDPSPTANQYHSPTETHFVVREEDLAPVTPSVLNAANRAQQPPRSAPILWPLLLLPGPAVVVLSWLQRKHFAQRRSTGQTNG